MDNLTEKYVNDDLDRSSYERLKNKYNQESEEIVIQLSETTDQSKDIQKFVDFGVQLLLSLDFFYRNANTDVKRQIIRSIFAEKLVYENKMYRTPKMNDAVSLIFNYNKDFGGLGKKTGGTLISSSRSVPSAGIEPAHLSILEFESSASTNSANWADVCFKLVCKYRIIF